MRRGSTEQVEQLGLWCQQQLPGPGTELHVQKLPMALLALDPPHEQWSPAWTFPAHGQGHRDTSMPSSHGAVDALTLSLLVRCLMECVEQRWGLH